MSIRDAKFMSIVPDLGPNSDRWAFCLAQSELAGLMTDSRETMACIFTSNRKKKKREEVRFPWCQISLGYYNFVMIIMIRNSVMITKNKYAARSILGFEINITYHAHIYIGPMPMISLPYLRQS